MNKCLFTICKFRWVLIRILSIVVILAMAFPVTGSVNAQEPTPFLVALPDWESVQGYAYPLGVNVRFEVDWSSPAPPLPVPWRDEFDGMLLDGWYWKNGDSGQWNLDEVPGFEIPCGAMADTCGVYYVAQVGQLSAGIHVASVRGYSTKQ